MRTHERLAERLPAVLDTVTSFLSVAGVGVVSDDGPSQRLLTWVDRQGLVARHVGAGETAVSAAVGAGPGQLIAVPLPDADPASSLLAMVGSPDATPDDQVARLRELAADATAATRVPEPLDMEMTRLRRRNDVEALLQILVRAGTVDEIVDHVSRVTQHLLRHDYLTVRVFDDGRDHEVPAGLLYTIDRDAPRDGQGWRSWIRVPLRVQGRVAGMLEAAAAPAGVYTPADAVLGARIADYIALALSHRRLVEDARAAAALRTREDGFATLDSILSTVTEVLDVREVFDRIFELSQPAMAHDAMSMAVATRDDTHIMLYAATGAVRHLPIGLEIPMPDPSLLERSWEFEVIADMFEDTRYARTFSAKAGMRSLIMIPVRVGQQVRGWINFFSRTPHRFSPEDITVARRIGAHLLLTLSHQRLADEARANAELRARTTNLELLDELLEAMGESAGVTDLFNRIAAIAGKVLPHDAALLMVRLPDGVQARVYARSGPGIDQLEIPDVTEVPEELLHNPDWEHDIFDDLTELSAPRYQRLARMGFLSLVRVPIRLDGQFAGALVFLARTRAFFPQASVLAARRMADRLTVTLAHNRQIAALRRADEATARAAQLETRVRALTDELDARTGYRRVVGESKEWREVLTQAAKVAATDTTVLLLGESGTGKEVVARFLHRGSPRASGPFIGLNCAALPEQLLEAELFGYERGAFTGAMQAKPGQLEQAAGGTLFLDEVGEMSLPAQAKFLRVLQEREFQRLGGTRVLRTDARIVAATNRDLQQGIAAGQFREDLYYRLNVFAIGLPPLRDRRTDVLPLAEAFLSDIARGLGTPPGGISREARQRLLDYHWPGNVRELHNVLERAAILCDGGLITAEHLALTVGTPPAAAAAVAPPPAVSPPVLNGTGTPAPQPATPTAAGELHVMERAMIERALRDAKFNKSKAAKALGVTRHQLYIRMRRHGLE